jgi:hypothetical protein
MSSVTCGGGLTGGVITTSGTCALPVVTNGVIIGNTSGITTTPTGTTLSAVADTITSARGAILYRGVSGWTALGPSVPGRVLTTNGAGADPSYTTVAGTGTVTSIAQGTGISLSSNPITSTGTASVDIGTNSNAWTATASKIVDASVLNTSLNPVTVTMTAGTVPLDANLGVDFTVTLTTTPTFSNPTNISGGRTGCMWITQPSTGYFTASFGSNWKFAGGSAPTLTASASAVDVLCYKARTSSYVWGSLNKDIR